MTKRLLVVLLVLGLAGPVFAEDFIRFTPPAGIAELTYSSNVLELSNGTSAQEVKIFNTKTDASNGEWGFLRWESNVLMIGTDENGSGTSRPLWLLADSGIVAFGKDNSTLYAQLSGFSFRPQNNDDLTLGTATAAKYFKALYLTRSIQGSKTKALSEGSATTVATVAVPQTAGSNFAAGEFLYTAYASDGTETQTLNGSAFFSAINKAGTETCTLTDDQIGTEASSSGTLACTITCVVGLTDVVGLAMDCTSSLSQTSLNGLVRFDMQQVNTLVFP